MSLAEKQALALRDLAVNVAKTKGIVTAPDIYSFHDARNACIAVCHSGAACTDFRCYCSALSVSGDVCGLSGRFLASRLCIPKFRSPRQGFEGQCRSAAGIFGSLGRPKARRFEPGP
jgi:hypothetical protein